MTSADHFPDFAYTAGQLAKYLAAGDFFTIMLKDGNIVHFTPKDMASFKDWLDGNEITNLRSEEGWIITTRNK